MSPADYLLMAGIICAVVAAVFSLRRRRKKGGCCGDCSSCTGCTDRSNIFTRPPDVEVVFRFNGTRKTPVADGYRPAHQITGDDLTTGLHHYYDVSAVPPDGIARGTITFLSPEACRHCLRVGQCIPFQEGARVVGCATITRIYDPTLWAQTP